MEYEDELDRMRNRKRRPAVRQTEIKKQTVSRRYAEPEKCKAGGPVAEGSQFKGGRRFLYVWKFTGSG